MVAEWWGDWSSLLGLLVAVVGFAYTLRQVRKSRTAAEAANAAAQATRDAIRHSMSLVDITGAVNTVQEIVRLQRTGAWPTVLDRYQYLKTCLIRLREQNHDLPSEQRLAVQSTITQISTLQDTIEEHVAHPESEPDTVRWNRILLAISDKLEALSASVHTQGANP